MNTPETITLSLTPEHAEIIGTALGQYVLKTRKLAANAKASVERCDECGKYSGFAYTRQKMHERNERLASEAWKILSYAKYPIDGTAGDCNSSHD
jgi:hypothetical protein